MDFGGYKYLAVYFPSVLIYFLLGATQATTFLLPLLASLANVCFLFAITRQISRSDSAAIVAALLLAFFPLEIFYATAAPQVVYQTSLFLAGVWATQLALQTSRFWVYAVLLVVAALLILLEPWFLAALSVIFVYGLLDKHGSRGVLLAALLVSTVFLFAVGWQGIGPAFLRFYALIVAQKEMLLYLPLMYVAFSVILLTRQQSGFTPLVWVFSVVIAFVVREQFVTSTTSGIFEVGAYLSVFLLAGLVVIAIYFSRAFSVQQIMRYSILLASLGTLTAVMAVLGSAEFLPSMRGIDWVGWHSLFIILSILAGPTFAIVLASPLFLTGASSVRKTSIAGIFLLFLLLAGLPVSWERRAHNHYGYASATDAATHLAQTDSPWSVYVLANKLFTTQLILQSHIQSLGGSEQTLSVLDPDKGLEIEQGLVLVADDFSVPSNTWLQLAKFGSLGTPRLVLYRVLTEETAHEYVRQAENQVATHGAQQSWGSLYEALVNAGEFCQSYLVMQKIQSEAQHIRSAAYDQTSAPCFQLADSLVNLADLRKQSSIQGYVSFGVEGQEEGVLPIFQPTLPIYDMRTVSVDVVLEPNSIYLYSFDIQTKGQTATLYWKTQFQEDYSQYARYPEWTSLSILLFTPDWGEAQVVTLAPALFDHLETVFLRNLYIGEVQFVE